MNGRYEFAAITKCRNLKKAHRIVITRYNRQGEPVNAKPCPVCTELIRISGIKFIEWTTEDE